MPITINGSGTVTGISAGGLPDGIITRPEMGYAGAVLQVVNFQTGTRATGTATIPLDNTIPQNTEGTEFLSLSITPTNSTSKLLIDIRMILAGSVTTALTAALFQDATANALASMFGSVTVGDGLVPVSFSHYMTSGTTASTTFKVRAGLGGAGTTAFNGNSTASYMGGTLASSITITELAS